MIWMIQFPKILKMYMNKQKNKSKLFRILKKMLSLYGIDGKIWNALKCTQTAI